MLRNLGFHLGHKKKAATSGELDKKISENNNIPLEEILAEDSLIDEIQSQNKTLIKYFNKDKIRQMIDYIIKEPPNDDNHDIGHKFPWVCSQLFNIGDSNIMKYFLKTNQELEEEEKEENKNDNNNNDIENKNSNNIKINEIEHKKENSNRIELLDYLLTFLSSNSEPNYVLCGYFASIIKTLLGMNQTLIIKYLYLENKEFIRKLIYHSYRQSISEILNKIVQYDSNEDEYNIEDMALIRMDILEGLFDQIDINMDNEKLDSISTLIKSLATDERLLSEMVNNRKIIECLITRPFKHVNLTKKDKNGGEEVVINKRKNFNILIEIIISWINYINSFDIEMPSSNDDEDEDEEGENDKEKDKDKEKEKAKDENSISDSSSSEEDSEFNHTLLSYALFEVLRDLIKFNFNKNNNNDSDQTKILQSFDDKLLAPLGQYRIKIVELLGHLFTYFKNIPSLYDKLLIDSQFFENAFAYLFEYELNNVYQEALLFLLKKFLNYSSKHSLLAEFIFEKLKIMDMIITKLKNVDLSENPEENKDKDRFVYKSGSTTSRGYIAFLISLAYKINTIIGGDPLRINDTLSREGSISFITRTAPFVTKEEINDYYGMDENELYEAVSHESREKTSKLNCAVKSMEKYLNDSWNEFFYDHIADKIRLYETKLYKEDKNRDSIFHNPFVLENDDVGDMAEDEDVLGKQKKQKGGVTDYEKFLYGDEDMDMGMNRNRFKMSMRLPMRSFTDMNPDNNVKKSLRGSGGNSKPSKILVDEIDDTPEKKDDKEEEEEENPLDKFKRESRKRLKGNEDEEEEENPLDKFKRVSKNRLKRSTEPEEEENPLDKFNREHKNNNNNNADEEEEENPLDKFNREHKNNNNNNADEEEEENPLDKFKRENKGGEEEEENPLDKLKKQNHNNNNDEEEENPLDKFKRLNHNNNDEEEEENPLDKFKKQNNKNNGDEEEEENPLDKFKRLNNK